MTEVSLRGYIYTWLSGVLSALWVGSLSDRPIDTIAFVWHMEDSSRPATPILEGRLSSDVRIGRDKQLAPDAITDQSVVYGDREIMFYLTAFGIGSVDNLKTIRNAIEDNMTRPTYSVNNFAIAECSPILDAHVFLDTMPEDRATMDLRLRYIDSWTNAPGIIQHVHANGHVDSKAIPGPTV